VPGLIAAGLKNRESSLRPFVSEETVRSDVFVVLRKPQVIDRVQAIILAHNAGMGAELEG